MDFLKTIYKVFRNEPLANRDIDVLGQWLASEDGREKFDEEIIGELTASLNDPGLDYDSVMKRISRKIDERTGKQQRKSNLSKYRKIAAAAAVLIVAGTAYFLAYRDQAVQSQTIPAGGPVAMLQLHDGTTVDLTDLKTDLIDQKGAKTTIRNGEITYDDSQLSDRMIFNKISIPKGGEYKVVLTDGTAVWLNSESQLQYPLKFGKNERRVLLSGEAYFEVTPDADKPFVVETGSQELTVLGTSFNISAYGDEARTLTTLVSGSVAVVSKTLLEQRILTPGQQLQLDRTDGQFAIAEVNVDQIIAWKNGLFVFDDQDLYQVMRKLARWYDVEVTFESEDARHIVFQGNLPRYNDLPTLLGMIEKISPAKFEIKGNTVRVKM